MPVTVSYRYFNNTIFSTVILGYSQISLSENLYNDPNHGKKGETDDKLFMSIYLYMPFCGVEFSRYSNKKEKRQKREREGKEKNVSKRRQMYVDDYKKYYLVCNETKMY